jgi:hypothetical protein
MMLLFHSAGWAVAQSDTATWDASSSNWSDTTHWNHSNVAASGLVPNNGNGGFTYGVVVPGGTVAQNLAGGVTISSLSIDPAARLDLTTGSATINYGLSPSPIATIKGYLVTGRNGGFWNGPGIDSSAVAADSSGWSRYAVGWQDTGQHVIVKYTLNGDSTLDGVVDFNDLLLVAKNYNNQFGTTSWRLGDFNYDGITNWFDLLIVSQNYNRRLQPPPIILDLSSHSLTDRSSAVATVPEPACIGFACGLILLTRGSPPVSRHWNSGRQT